MIDTHNPDSSLGDDSSACSGRMLRIVTTFEVVEGSLTNDKVELNTLVLRLRRITRLPKQRFIFFTITGEGRRIGNACC